VETIQKKLALDGKQMKIVVLPSEYTHELRYLKLRFYVSLN